MRLTERGWVIVGPSYSRKDYVIIPKSFQFTRKQCIAKFISHSGMTWEECRDNYRYRCVKAMQTTENLS